uniref:Uncharacterized protein n=1 Tax=Haptolina brevifila TaxID=156173 RepID=A0A7S2IQV5_9EUKA
MAKFTFDRDTTPSKITSEAYNDKDGLVRRLKAAIASKTATADEDVLLLICHSPVISMLRVQNDDGDFNQIIRRLMGDPLNEEQDAVWDVYQIVTEGVVSYKCNYLGNTEPPKDLKLDWEKAYALAV